MQQAVTQASGMVALKGNITFTQVMQLTQTHTCYLAIIIAEDHYVVGGLLTDLDALLDKAKNSGVKRAEKLAVKLPSHTPLLAQATVNFASYLQQFAAVSLELPILNALTQELIFNSQEMVPILANELSQTLHWNQVMSIAKEYGCSLLLEIGSGTALKNMASFQQLKAYSVGEFRSVQGVATFLKANA
jgi:[acyl-carrier-protein] S-malonyltransferase